MNKAPLHRGAVHEAGHAVMARLLGMKIGRIRIDLDDPSGSARACIEPTIAENRLLIAAAGDACLRALGFVTMHDEGAWSDEVEMENALSELHDDEADYPRYRLEAIAEVERRFEQPNVLAAGKALVAVLIRDGEIEGTEAREIIDRHLEDHAPE